MGNFEKVIITYSFVPDFSMKIGAGHGKYGIVDNAVRARTVVKKVRVKHFIMYRLLLSKGRFVRK